MNLPRTENQGLHFKVHSDLLLHALSKMHTLFAQDTLLTLYATNNNLHISAIDNKASFRARVPIEEHHALNKKFSIPLHLLHNLLKTGTGIWDFVYSETQLQLSFRTGQYKLPVITPEENFTENIDTITDSTEWLLGGLDFAQILKKATLAAGDQVQRGVYIHSDTKNKCIAAAATDGLRISCARYPYNTQSQAQSQDIGAILNKDICNALVRWLGKHDIRINLKTLKDPMIFKWEQDNIDYQLRVSTMQYRFPNYKPIIPTEGQSIEIEGSELSVALARIGLFAQDSKRIVLEPKGHELIVHSSSIDIGSGVESVAARCSPEAVRWCIDPKHLSDVLGKEKIVLQGGPKGPIRVQIHGQNNWIYVFMPST